MVSADGFTFVDANNPYMMQAAVNLGPLTVGIDASSTVFKHYSKGVFDHAVRCGTSLNHAVTVVGYSAVEAETPYWIVRNSWGDSWGEEGYIRIAIQNGDGVCGINLEPAYPNIYYQNVFDSGLYLALCILAIGVSVWPLIKLSWCRSSDLLFLHDG